MEQTHDKCKHFGHRQCPHIKDDIMVRANHETQPYYGKAQLMPQQPTDEEINQLCGECPAFTLK